MESASSIFVYTSCERVESYIFVEEMVFLCKQTLWRCSSFVELG